MTVTPHPMTIDHELGTRSALALLLHIDREVERLAGSLGPVLTLPAQAHTFLTSNPIDWIHPGFLAPMGIRYRAHWSGSGQSLELILEDGAGNRLHSWRVAVRFA